MQFHSFILRTWTGPSWMMLHQLHHLQREHRYKPDHGLWLARIVQSWTVGNVPCSWWYMHVRAPINQAGYASDCVVKLHIYFNSSRRWEHKPMPQPCCQWYIKQIVYDYKKNNNNPLDSIWCMAIAGFNHQICTCFWSKLSSGDGEWNRNGELNNLMSGWCVKSDFLWRSKEKRANTQKKAFYSFKLDNSSC